MAILEAAYPQARRIAFDRWLGRIDPSEIDALVATAVVKLLDGEAAVIDVPRTVKYLTTFVDWRATDHLRAQRRRIETGLPDDESRAPDGLREALTAREPSPHEVMDSFHTRQVLAELKRAIPNRINRLIVHLAFSEERSCSQIAQTIKRVLGVELSAKAVEMRKYQSVRALTVEWDRVLRGEHCREFATATGAGNDALTRYALDAFDRDHEEDRRLLEVVSAHVEHCLVCRAAVVERRHASRRTALLAVPILVGEDGTHPLDHLLAHGPGVFERALETVRSGVGRGTLRVVEAVPDSGPRAAELIGSAGAGSGAAVGGGLVAKVLVAGTAAVCAFGGQQICAGLLATGPAMHSHPRVVQRHAHRSGHQTAASLRPPVPPPAGVTPAPTARRLGGSGARTIRRAQAPQPVRSPQVGTPPPTTHASSGNSSASDPTFDQSAPSGASASKGGSSGGGSSGSGSSGGDSTFESLP